MQVQWGNEDVNEGWSGQCEARSKAGSDAFVRRLWVPNLSPFLLFFGHTFF